MYLLKWLLQPTKLPLTSRIAYWKACRRFQRIEISVEFDEKDGNVYLVERPKQ